MYALVEYISDRTQAVLEHCDVENFNPRNVADFDPAATYEAYWRGDSTTEGGYYTAKMLHLTETEEEMQLHAEKRCRRPVVVNSTKRKSKEKNKVLQPTAKKPRKEVQKRHEQELLQELEEQSGDTASLQRTCTALREEVSKMRKELADLRDKVAQREDADSVASSTCRCQQGASYEELKAEVKELRALNADLQKSLTQNIFSCESRVIYCSSFDVHVTSSTTQLPGQKAKGSSGRPSTSTGTSHSRLDSLALPRAVPSAVPSAVPPAVPSAAQPMSTEVSQSGSIGLPPTATGMMSCSSPQESVLPPLLPSITDASDSGLDEFDVEMDNEVVHLQLPGGEDAVIGSSRDDGKVYTGSGIWIEDDAWQMLLRAPTDSMFCRSATQIYWTPDQLRARIVTGVLSNKCRSLGRTEAKPALTPGKVSSLKALFHIYMGDVPKELSEKRLKAVRKHLSQKLGDMQRSSKGALHE